MSNFREAQDHAKTSKSNILISGIIVILILIITLQIWLMYGTLNNALNNDNNHFSWAAFVGSTFLFIVGLLLMRYLPNPRKAKKKTTTNKYE